MTKNYFSIDRRNMFLPYHFITKYCSDNKKTGHSTGLNKLSKQDN